MNKDILVNNRDADFDTLVYENFSIEWTVLSFGVADEPYVKPAFEDASESEVAYEDEAVVADETQSVPADETYATTPGTSIVVFVNGEPVTMTGKDEYIFVDIFDRITFDLAASRGRAIATLVNGRDAQFTEKLSHGDKVELYWKEN